jgi:TatD DNase family protein
MASDAHCHPFDLSRVFPDAEDERRRLGVSAAASAWGDEDFAYNEALARNAPENAPIALCFACHPQLPAVSSSRIDDSLLLLERLLKEKRLAAIGECGFDLFDAAYKATEKTQAALFQAHVEAALKYDMPLVLHARRAMHRIFEYKSALKKIRGVVFHSFSGTEGEAAALLRAGINAFFSFGTAILLNHKRAAACVSTLPLERLLFETDAPYMPLRGQSFSHYADLDRILDEAAALRALPRTALEAAADWNFARVFWGG